MELYSLRENREREKCRCAIMFHIECYRCCEILSGLLLDAECDSSMITALYDCRHNRSVATLFINDKEQLPTLMLFHFHPLSQKLI